MLPVKSVPGLAFICQMCEHMAGAVNKGLEDCGQPGCGGITQGRAFPLYKGPLQRVWTDFCHRCGQDSTQVIEIGDGGRLGICVDCLKNLLDNGILSE